jgi:sugar O-acyltransferase (sialic acid O-acetyltransferase NeuD family)
MKNLFIIGASPFGREVFAWAKQTREFGSSWTIKGFLDDRPNILDGFNCELPIVASVEAYTPKPDDLFVCALGDPGNKRKYVGLLQEKGAVFTNIIHPSAVFGDNVSMGHGVIVCPHVTVSSGAKVGHHVSINGKSGVGHDASIGDWSCIQSFCDITGFAKIGASVVLNSHAVILPKVHVEDNAVIGAGSVVIKNVRAGQTVFGIPAMPLNF